MKQLVPAKLLRSLSRESTARLELPGDLIHEARRRVRVAAGVGGVVYAVFLLVGLTRLTEPTDFERQMNFASNLIGVTLCLSVFLVALLPRIKDSSVLTIALAAEVLLCALISVEAPWVHYSKTAHVPSLTWVIPIIIFFPLLVPAAPPVALLISGLSALMVPAGLLLLDLSGMIAVEVSDYWRSGLSVSMAVVIAMVGAHTIHGAGRQLAAARKVGSYELQGLLGKGGMGEVWKARHRFLARPAAVKLILPAKLQDPDELPETVLKRFEREAKVTASLRSPHTVELFDFGMTSQGALYYAMEMLQGMNAEHFVYRFGALPARRAVHWLRQACHSLGEAHAQNLVHRDIKPANLVACRYGRDVDFIKVLDFGLVKSIVQTGDDTSPQQGRAKGTPAYMAPEQALGLPTDARTDLYALGCVGYWLLAARKPFEADAPEELMQQHAQAQPPALSSMAQGPVPVRLEAILMSCLCKDPKDRPADADQLSAALADSLEGEAPWSDDEANHWWEHNLKDV